MLNVHSIESFGTHDGPGIRLVLFLQGCPLRCVYCHNPDTQSLNNPQAQHLTTAKVLELLEKHRPYFKENGGLTVSGGEPTLQAKALISLFKRAKALGFHTALDTNGALFNRTINQLYDLTDLVILDVKHINPKWHQKVTSGSVTNVLKNAAYREKTGKPLWLRYVLVPGWTDQPEYLEEWAQYFKEYRSLERVEILPYHTLGVHKYQKLGMRYELTGINPPSQEQQQQALKIFLKHLPQTVLV